ncbi:MAG: TIGR03905 family TSCPD domain-containing protein [Bacilli bacterium]
MDKSFVYYPKGTCSVRMDFLLDDSNVIKDMKVQGGCNGNLKGIRSLIIGMKAQDVIEKLDGIKCVFKNTSCPDQMAKALREFLFSEKTPS